MAEQGVIRFPITLPPSIFCRTRGIGNKAYRLDTGFMDSANKAAKCGIQANTESVYRV